MFIKHCNQSGEIVYVTEIRKKRIQMAALDGARRRLFIDCTGIGIAVSWARVVESTVSCTERVAAVRAEALHRGLQWRWERRSAHVLRRNKNLGVSSLRRWRNSVCTAWQHRWIGRV